MGLDDIIRITAAAAGTVAYVTLFGYLGFKVGQVTASLQRKGTWTKNHNQVAVITIDGPIGAVPLNNAGNDANYLKGCIDSLVDNKTVKGIVLEVNSGGGLVYAGFEMVDLLRHVRAGTYHKKLAPMHIVGRARGVAASAAYHLLCACDYIVANATSLVGSIGAFTAIPDASELMKNYGVKVHVFKTAKFKAAGMPFVGMNDEEKQIIDQQLNECVEYFLRDVALGRRMTVDALKETYANGLCFYAEKVVSSPEKPGLVDYIGNRMTAVWVLEQLGKFTCDNVFEVYPPIRGFNRLPFRMSLTERAQRYLIDPSTQQL
ncbi:S49 family peptidase [Candidatus Woesearchaeota archaeon]|nr:S49 family peptidase [Candidatus Woesearchaeota archaeon]